MCVCIRIGFGDSLVAPVGATKHLDATGLDFIIQRFDDRADRCTRIVFVEDVDVDRLELHLSQARLEVRMDVGRCQARLVRLRFVLCALAHNHHVVASSRASQPLTKS